MAAMELEVQYKDPAVQAKYTELVNRLQADADTVAKLEASETPEEIYEAIKKYLTAGFEQFKTVLTDTLERVMAVCYEAQKDRELDLDELDMVTGGGNHRVWNWLKKNIGTVVCAAVAVIGLGVATVATGGAADVALAVGFAGIAGGTLLGVFKK